jgi:hypothetical protein
MTVRGGANNTEKKQNGVGVRKMKGERFGLQKEGLPDTFNSQELK